MNLDYHIPPHLIVSLVRKLEAKSFVRVYRSCKFLRNVIDSSKRSINVSTKCTLSLTAVVTDDPDRHEVLVEVLKGKGVVYWSRQCTPDQVVQSLIPTLAFFKFQSIVFKWTPHFSASKMQKIMSAFGQYKISFERGTVTADTPCIGTIVRKLQISQLELVGSMRQMSSDCNLAREDAKLLKSLSLDCCTISGPVGKYLLCEIAPNVEYFSLKLFGSVEKALPLIAGCIRTIRDGSTSPHSGKITLYHSGRVGSFSEEDVLAQLNLCSFKFVREHETTIIMLPFEKEAQLAVALKCPGMMSRRAARIEIHYATVCSQGDLLQILSSTRVKSEGHYNLEQNNRKLAN